MPKVISLKHLLEHRPKREGLFKFLLLLAVLAGYFGYLSWEYDLKTGGVVAALTWSFFVLCTPIADAGFLLDMHDIPDPDDVAGRVKQGRDAVTGHAQDFAVNLLALFFNDNFVANAGYFAHARDPQHAGGHVGDGAPESIEPVCRRCHGSLQVNKSRISVNLFLS